jgi:hypothetical protein
MGFLKWTVVVPKLARRAWRIRERTSAIQKVAVGAAVVMQASCGTNAPILERRVAALLETRAYAPSAQLEIRQDWTVPDREDGDVSRWLSTPEALPVPRSARARTSFERRSDLVDVAAASRVEQPDGELPPDNDETRSDLPAAAPSLERVALEVSIAMNRR